MAGNIYFGTENGIGTRSNKRTATYNDFLAAQALYAAVGGQLYPVAAPAPFGRKIVRARRPTPVGPDISHTLDDTDENFDAEANWNALGSITVPDPLRNPQCTGPLTCPQKCAENQKKHREKCDALRKKVACALKNAGCPSNVTAKKKGSKKRSSVPSVIAIAPSTRSARGRR